METLSISGGGRGSSPVRGRVSDTEWEARIDLAAAYRLVAHFGWSETIYNHISLRVPGEEGHFLINGFGLLYEEITAANLVKVSTDGDVLDDPTGLGINRAGFVIHGALHAARSDIACVLHTHSAAGMAVSAQDEGLLPLTQHAVSIYGNVAYHDFEGVALDTSEQERLVRDLGGRRIMILRNHGLLTAGRSVGEAMQLMGLLERACVAQVMALSGGVRLVAPDLVSAASDLFEALGDSSTREWAALLRLSDRVSPGFR